jgi:hypothetical protein
MYKIIDQQGTDWRANEIYHSLYEIYCDLFDLHSADHDTTNWTLRDCLEIGDWRVVDLQGNEVAI